MAGSVVFKEININSHKGKYTVNFIDELIHQLKPFIIEECHFILDANVAKLYPAELSLIVNHKNTLIIEATENNKSFQKISIFFEKLLKNNIRKNHKIIAIGGGIIQDITCFIASTLFRGIDWFFFPTTLLAQADSCVGSKSSINLGSIKNIIGTFYPPKKIFIYSRFLETLELKDLLSGIGEIIKVHAIESSKSFDELSNNYSLLKSNYITLSSYTRKALIIKKKFIEEDEFDIGVRNIFNYGHSFGHAIETATNFEIPHGIAVTIGMDMANFIASESGILPKKEYIRMHALLKENYYLYKKYPIHIDLMYSALMKDKKNVSNKFVLILPSGEDAKVNRVEVINDEVFNNHCRSFFSRVWFE